MYHKTLLKFIKAHPRYVFHRHGDTIQLYQQQSQVGCFGECELSNTFCEFVARFIFPKSDEASTVPRKMDLNWFIPALVKRRVGSDRGATGEEGTVYKNNFRSVHVVGGGGGVGKKRRRMGSTHRMYGHFV